MGDGRRGGGLAARQSAVRRGVGPYGVAVRAAYAVDRRRGGERRRGTGVAVRGADRLVDGGRVVPGAADVERRVRRGDGGGAGPGAAGAAGHGRRVAGRRADPGGAGRDGPGDLGAVARHGLCGVRGLHGAGGAAVRAVSPGPGAARGGAATAERAGVPCRVRLLAAAPPRSRLGLADPLPDQSGQRAGPALPAVLPARCAAPARSGGRGAGPDGGQRRDAAGHGGGRGAVVGPGGAAAAVRAGVGGGDGGGDGGPGPVADLAGGAGLGGAARRRLRGVHRRRLRAADGCPAGRRPPRQGPRRPQRRQRAPPGHRPGPGRPLVAHLGGYRTLYLTAAATGLLGAVLVRRIRGVA